MLFEFNYKSFIFNTVYYIDRVANQCIFTDVVHTARKYTSIRVIQE
jgi:hypothetical protein